MRLVIFFSLLASPLAAWEFSPSPVCTLTHNEGAAELRVTFDPRQPEPYAITVTHPTSWAASDLFAMRFDGPSGLTISTGRHRTSADGRALTVRDRGFGNVLDGLEFNMTAKAISGASDISFSLEGAAPEVQKFRACVEAPLT